jgi:hypothetical protein
MEALRKTEMRADIDVCREHDPIESAAEFQGRALEVSGCISTPIRIIRKAVAAPLNCLVSAAVSTSFRVISPALEVLRSIQMRIGAEAHMNNRPNRRGGRADVNRHCNRN